VLEVRGLKLESEWHGPREGPVLVFLHEGLGSVALWRGFPEKLSRATGLGAFVYSRAGYGQSDPVPLPRSVRYMHEEAELLSEILKRADIREPVLVGHSDGASIDILHAGAGGPARALILEAPHVFTEEPGLRSIEAARDAYLRGPLRERLSRWHKDVDAAFWGWNGPWLDPEFRKWNIEESLPRIQAPILVVQGESDEYGTVEQVEAIRRGAGGPVEAVLLPECGHSPHGVKPEETLRVMSDFLARRLQNKS
jgi:pimeloyl-ACP methyl ester carboxylesterase